MNPGVILFIAIGAVFGLMILLNYAPVYSRFFGISWSPKLFVAKLLAPFDIGITLFLILGAIVGVTTVTGISMIVFNVATGIGLSIGVIIVRKLLVPRWKAQYELLKSTGGRA